MLLGRSLLVSVLACSLVSSALAEVCGRPNETDMNPVPTPCPEAPYVNDVPADWTNDSCRGSVWPLADLEIDGDWWPSRSTHYGSTADGACGFGNFVNCASNTDTGCEGIPEDILRNPQRGNYAAPQGSYYSQGLPRSYTSCGECFEVKCVDTKWCPHPGNVVTVRIADSCPCANNVKWCCGNQSQCQELTPDQPNNKSHCPVNDNHLWDDVRSIHLDLNDAAMSAVSGGMPGIANTMARRVSCKAYGNIWLTTGTQTIAEQYDYTYPPNKTWCVWWLSLVAVNVAGSGSLSSLEIEATQWSRDSIPVESRKWISMPLDSCTLLTRPQEQYGAFKLGYEQNTRLFWPWRFRLRNRFGQELITNYIESVDHWRNLSNTTGKYRMWFDTGVQFPAIPKDDSGKAVINSTATSSSAPTPIPATVSSDIVVPAASGAVSVTNAVSSTLFALCALAFVLSLVF